MSSNSPLKLKWLVLLVLLPFWGYTQNERPLTKIGGFVYTYRFTRVSGYSLNYAREKTFKNNAAFTHGLRVDYSRAKPFPQGLFPGYENLILGYEFKIYPLYTKNKGPYNGLFLGLFPCYLIYINTAYKYGPGLGSLIGYQFWIKNRFTLSAEAGPIYMQNINEHTVKHNPQDRYYYFFANIKVGLKL